MYLGKIIPKEGLELRLHEEREINFDEPMEIIDLNKGMCVAANVGNKELIDLFIEKGANDWTMGMIAAGQGGHKKLVDFFISKYEDAWREIAQFLKIEMKN